jgi:hypothetical protein
MVKLHLVGFSSDLKSLVFSTRRGAKSGTYMVDVNPRLKRTLEEIASREAESQAEEAVEQPKPAATQRRLPARPERPPVPPSKLSPKEIQALLREGKTPDEVARLAESDVSWIERFTSPILAERAVVVDIVKAARITRMRRGLSSMPVGEAILENLADKKIRVSPEEFDEGWSAIRREGQWEVTFSYSSRGRGMDSAFVVDHDRNVRAANPQASSLGWRPQPGDEDADDAPAETAPRIPPARAEAPAPPPAAAKPAPLAPAPASAAAADPGTTAPTQSTSPPAPARRGWSLPTRRPSASPPPSSPVAETKPAERTTRSGPATSSAKPASKGTGTKVVPTKGTTGRTASAKPAATRSAAKSAPAKSAPAKSAAARQPTAAAKPKPAAKAATSRPRTSAAPKSPASPKARAAAASGPAGGTSGRSRTAGPANPASARKPAAAPPPVRGAAMRRRDPVPPLRPGQAVSLADVGWSLPVDRGKTRPSSGKGPSGRL